MYNGLRKFLWKLKYCLQFPIDQTELTIYKICRYTDETSDIVLPELSYSLNHIQY